jgi:F-type H+-transporting ATPase subunit b
MVFLFELNPLVKPDFGLIVWTGLTFAILLFLLGKFAWKPIMNMIHEREQGIADALAQADKVKAEMAQMKNENEALMAQAREERAQMLKEAKEAKDKIVNEAKEQAKAEASKIMAETQEQINNQKMAALTDVKNQIGSLVIDVAEKVLRKEMADKAAQETYIKQLAEEITLN